MINKEIYISKFNKIKSFAISEISDIYIGTYNKNLLISHSMGNNSFEFLNRYFNLETQINPIIIKLLSSKEKHKILLGLNLL